MQEIMRITLDARQVRRACEQYVIAQARIDTAAQDVAAANFPNVAITVVVTKKRAPRKPKTNGVASASGLSPAEERFA